MSRRRVSPGARLALALLMSVAGPGVQLGPLPAAPSVISRRPAPKIGGSSGRYRHSKPPGMHPAFMRPGALQRMQYKARRAGGRC